LIERIFNSKAFGTELLLIFPKEIVEIGFAEGVYNSENILVHPLKIENPPDKIWHKPLISKH